jgi:hypothetical protein
MGSHRTRVVAFNAITTQGLSDNSLSTMSATASVPGAMDKENHFLLVNTRRTNWQVLVPVVTEMLSTMATRVTDEVVHRVVYISRESSLLR